LVGVTEHTGGGDAARPAAEQLLGEWRAERIGDAGPLADPVPTVTFTDDGHVYGTGGVNRFRGPYRLEGGTVEFGPAQSTLMAGPRPAMEQEGRLVATLSGRRPFTVDADALVIGEGADRVVLRRARAGGDR
jgi:heat shock protein HslJ